MIKKKQVVLNIISSFGGQLITIFLGIVLPKLFIVSFGSEVNGLLSSVNQVYVYIGLLEAGVGTATLQSLYKPVANDNKKEINSILSATKIYYYKTGFFYAIAVIGFAVIYPIFIKTSIDFYTIFLIILFGGFGNAIIYFFHGKYKIFLNASGKGYVINNISTFAFILTNIVKIAMILKGFDVVAVQFAFFIINLIQIIIFQVYIKRNYKWLDLNCDPNYEAISKKNSVLIHQISYLIFSNTDIIILSLFCDLKIVSIYTIYNLIYSSISNVLNSINGSIVYTIGQLYQTNKEKFMELTDCYELYYTMLNYICYTITLILIIPFLKLYTEGITDANYIDIKLVFMFSIIYILIASRTAMTNIINISGHFKETQNRAIIEAILNLVFSLIGVKFLGMYGVLLGTIIGLLYRTNDIIIYSNNKILNRSSFHSYKNIFINLLLMFVVSVVFYKFIIPFTLIDSYMKFFIYACGFGIAISLIFFVINSLCNIKIFKSLFKIIKSK